MKESSSHKSKKHSKQDHVKRHNRNGHAVPESDRYRNALKERHYKEVSEPERREKNHRNEPKHHSHSNKDKSRSSEHNGRHNHKKPTVFSSSGRSEDQRHKSQKHRSPPVDESYEELSRKKRRIEYELQALDLEEAAAKQAESKKTVRHSSDTNKRKEAVRIKEEPVSDDERHRRKARQARPVTSNGRPQIKLEPTDAPGDDKWGKPPKPETKKPAKEKEKPDFAVSGKLAEDTNTYNGVVIKYNEPTEARKPRRRWRLYPFKGDSDLPFIPIHRQSAYLFGRTRSIADIPIDHPSCSKQHAVLQFRLIPYKREDGTTGRRVRPYIIDLESANGTFVNNKRIDPRCYVELIEKDVVKFGYSSREYVVLHEESRNEEEDDDVLDSPNSNSEKE